MVLFGCLDALHPMESVGRSTVKELSKLDVESGQKVAAICGAERECRWRLTYHMSKYLKVINQANKM